MLLVKVLHFELKTALLATKVNPGYHFQPRRSPLYFVTFSPVLINNSVICKLLLKTYLLQKSTMMSLTIKQIWIFKEIQEVAEDGFPD